MNNGRVGAQQAREIIGSLWSNSRSLIVLRSRFVIGFCAILSMLLMSCAEQVTLPEVFTPPSIQTPSLPDAEVGVSYSATLTATGGNGSYSWSVTSGFPPWLSLSSSGTLTGTPDTAGQFTLGVSVTSQGKSTDRTLQLNVDWGAPKIVDIALTNAMVGEPYTDTLKASGGDGIYEWALSGGSALPQGLRLTALGEVRGTPAEDGDFALTFQVSSVGRSVSRRADLLVSPAPILRITTVELDAGREGAEYAAQFEAAGGDSAYTWRVTSGSLPTGLTLSDDGLLNGTPTVESASSFRVRVTSGSETADRDFELGVNGLLRISNPELLRPIVDTAYQYAFSATGGGGSYVWSLASGSLPSGLELTAEGSLNGTPSAEGASAIEVRAQSGDGQTVEATMTIEVVPPGPTVSAVEVTPDTARVLVGADSLFDAVIRLSDGSELQDSVPTWTRQDQTVASVSAAGLVSGVGTGSTEVRATYDGVAGVATVQVGVDYRAQSLAGLDLSFQDYRWAELSGMNLISTVFRGSNLSGATLVSANMSGADLWQANLSGASLSGVTWQGASFSTGTLWPTGFDPEGKGMWGPGLDYSGSDLSSRDFDGYDFRTSTFRNADLSNTSLEASRLEGADFTNADLADVNLWDANLSDAVLTGATWTGARFNIATAWPAEFDRQGRGMLGPGVDYSALDLSGQNLNDNDFRGSDFVGTNLQGASLRSSLMQGADLSDADASGTSLHDTDLTRATLDAARVTGSNLTGAVLDDASLHLTVYDSLTVWPSGFDPVAAGAVEVLRITTSSLADGEWGQSYADTLSAVGGDGLYSWTLVTGTLPAGISLASSGMFSGAPEAVGTSTFSVKVESGDGQAAQAEVQITIAQVATLEITTSSLETGQVGQPYVDTLQAEGGIGPISWALTVNALPSGLELSSDGVLSGTPTTFDDWSFGVRAQSQDGQSVEAMIDLNIRGNIKMVSASNNHTMVLLTDGTLLATGKNDYGQLADGTTNDRTTLAEVHTGYPGVHWVAAANDYTLFVKTAGHSLWGVGLNNVGQLGDNTFEDRPEVVELGNGYAMVSARGGYSLGVNYFNAQIQATGRNDYGQLGNGTTNTWSSWGGGPPNHGTVASVFAGDSHSAFIKTDGTLWMMGKNDWGQLGNNRTDTRVTTPVQVMSDVASAAVNSSYTIVLKTDGTVYGAGLNNYGQLGFGSVGQTSTFLAADVSDVKAIAAGPSDVFFLQNDGTLWAAGLNPHGEWGNGTQTGSSSPVEIADEVASMAIGAQSAFIVKTDGTLWAAGYNNGTFGNGTTQQSLTWIEIPLNR
ncbi:putative Ig domain-containing protein [Gemmatimonadales bacterium]|nr:putative Ig domain-containing protein [Gemmatimonadales bacterium]